MNEGTPLLQTGGVRNSGSVGSVGNDMAAGCNASGTAPALMPGDRPHPTMHAIRDVSATARPRSKLAVLRHDALNREQADDGRMGKLFHRKTELVHTATTTFGTQNQCGSAGPATGFSRDKLRRQWPGTS